ncbi:hypothetical protein J6590_014221 [Homalodisca vitripennis]|nr:hypothetical protein J6590_014221 [Homalodisca vitripennis]
MLGVNSVNHVPAPALVTDRDYMHGMYMHIMDMSARCSASSASTMCRHWPSSLTGNMFTVTDTRLDVVYEQRMTEFLVSLIFGQYSARLFNVRQLLLRKTSEKYVTTKNE